VKDKSHNFIFDKSLHLIFRGKYYWWKHLNGTTKMNLSVSFTELNVLRGTEKRIFNIHEISWTKFLRLAYIVDFDLKSILIFFYNYVYSPQQSSAPFCRSIPFKRRTWKKFYVFFLGCSEWFWSVLLPSWTGEIKRCFEPFIREMEESSNFRAHLRS